MILGYFDIEDAGDTLTEDGVPFKETPAGYNVLEAAKAYVKLTDSSQKVQVPINTFVSRRDDMGQGKLQLFREEDGDMCVAIFDTAGRSKDIQFCTYGMGGGRSPKVLSALYDLFRAMMEENEKCPLPEYPTQPLESDETDE
jgi:hypothetical protein